MVDDTAARKSKLEELIEKKRQEQDDERERQRRQREENIADIDFGDGSDDDNLDPRPEARGMFALFKTLRQRVRVTPSMQVNRYRLNVMQPSMMMMKKKKKAMRCQARGISIS